MKLAVVGLGVAVAQDDPFFGYRSRLRFSVPENWMNDPNGMVYDPVEKIYHLHYQHCPWEPVWCDMHWGHATSTDLVYWEHQPIAYYSDDIGMIFSGGGIVDENDVTGYGANTLVYSWTYHKAGDSWDAERQSQAMGHFDRETGEYVKDGVVIDDDECCIRDPQIVELDNAGTTEFYMMLANAQHQNIRYYKSADLKTWTRAGEFKRNDLPMHESVWECPDLLRFDVGGTIKYVQILSVNPGGDYGAPGALGSQTRYYVGDFDFTAGAFVSDFGDESSGDEPKIWLDHGPDNYAGVTFRNHPDGDIIFIGWMGNWGYAQVVPMETFRSQFTVPRKLELVAMADGTTYRLRSPPIVALDELRCGASAAVDLPADGNVMPLVTDHCGCTEQADIDALPLLLDITITDAVFKDSAIGAELVLSNDDGDQFSIKISLTEITIDRTQAMRGWSDATDDWEHFSNHTGPRYADVADQDNISLRVIVDVHSVEFFMDDYLTTSTATFYSAAPFTDVVFTGFACGDACEPQISINRMRSIFASTDPSVCALAETVPTFFQPESGALLASGLLAIALSTLTV